MILLINENANISDINIIKEKMSKIEFEVNEIVGKGQ